MQNLNKYFHNNIKISAGVFLNFSLFHSIPGILTFSCIEFLYAYQLLSSLPGISDTKKGGGVRGGVRCGMRKIKISNLLSRPTKISVTAPHAQCAQCSVPA